MNVSVIANETNSERRMNESMNPNGAPYSSTAAKRTTSTPTILLHGGDSFLRLPSLKNNPSLITILLGGDPPPRGAACGVSPHARGIGVFPMGRFSGTSRALRGKSPHMGAGEGPRAGCDMINGMKSSGKKRDNLGSIGKDFRWECNSIAESATKKEGNQPSFFVV